MERDLKKNLIKRAISSVDGWKALVQSIKSAPNPNVAEVECRSILHEIGQDKRITVPATDVANGEDVSFEADMSEILIWEFEKHLNGA